LNVQKEAYVKVQNISGTKEQLNVNVELRTDYGKKYVSYSFVPDMDGKNFIAQAYL